MIFRIALPKNPFKNKELVQHDFIEFVITIFRNKAITKWIILCCYRRISLSAQGYLKLPFPFYP